MADSSAVAAFVQLRLAELGLQEVAAVEAARWLDVAGILKDSPNRPGLPLRNLLRGGLIPQAEQRPPGPNGKWFIVRDASGTASAGPTESSVDHLTARITPSPARDVGVRDTPSIRTGQSHTNEKRIETHGAADADAFRRSGLVAQGFVGFQRFKGIDLEQVPQRPGVYVVLREKDSPPAFLERSPAGWFKGQDPTVSINELERSWPTASHCVYIGKAGAGSSGRRGLRKRIKELRQYGDGRPVGHQGGRRIWQLDDSDDYVIAWRPTLEEDPGAVEATLLHAFVAQYGKLPIGNRTTGQSAV